jgi:short-subunit dehydrogenase
MGLYTAVPADGAVWITGGSTGIGAESAIRFASEGFTVFVSARSEAALEALAQRFEGKGEIRPLPLDVTDRGACQSALNEIRSQGFEVAVALFNAGMFEHMKGSELSLDSFEKTFAVNFSGVVNCLVPVVDEMKRNGKGQIAVVASVSGYGGLKLASAYGASKAALINMCESLKFDFDPMNIKIQLVNPGFIDTPMTEKNKFPMPFLMPLDKAADRLVSSMKKDMFEITFPRRFTWMLKFINILPYPVYFWLVGRGTSGGKNS